MKSSYEELIAAKKENVALQLEGAYRSRINDAYQQVSPVTPDSVDLQRLHNHDRGHSVGLLSLFCKKIDYRD